MRPRFAEPAPAIVRSQQPRQRQDFPAARIPDQRPNWWLRFTSYGTGQHLRTIEERERSRHSRLLSWIILGLLAVDALLVPLGLGDQGTLIAIVGVGAALIIAIGLNRAGQVTLAGLLLVSLICAADILSLVTYPGGLRVDELPTFDLLAIAVVVAASVLPRIMAFVVAAVNTALICLVFFQLPHSAGLTQSLADYGGFPAGDISLLARPIGLQILVAVVAYLWVRGTDEAIRRADRAEELAALEHQLAEQKHQLDIGIQELLATHIRAANGDFSARAPLRQDNVLWQIASSLNNLLARMQRTAQAEHRLARTEEELRRIAGAIDEARAGRQPMWPMPTGTAADLILERITRDQHRAPVGAGFGAAALPSHARGGAPFAPGYGPGYGQGPSGAGPSQPLAPGGFGQGGVPSGGYGQPAVPSGGYGPPAAPGGFGQGGVPSGGYGQPGVPSGGYGQGGIPSGYGQGGFGAPVPPSQPAGQPYAAPAQQLPANDPWPLPAPSSMDRTSAGQPSMIPARPSGPTGPVPPSPWMLSPDEVARDARDAGDARDAQDPPPDWPDLPPMGEWTIPANNQ